MTEEIPLQLFSDCANAMKLNEFIHCDKFMTKTALSAADFTGTRVDAYALAKGHITFEEVMQHLGNVPNENATPEQILEICGRFVDLQASRVDGHLALTNIFTTIYMQKEFEIKHPVLKFMFKVFKHASKRIEMFARRVFSESSVRCWAAISPEMFDELEESDDESLKSELAQLNLDPALKGLAEFELALASFLVEPRERTLDCEFIAPSVSSEIGCDQMMRYRDAPPSTTPNWPQIPEHNRAIEIMKGLSKEFEGVKKLMADVKPIDDLIEDITNWNEEGEHTSLTRALAIHLLTDSLTGRTELFGKVKVNDYIRDELKAHHIPHKFFISKDYSAFLEMTVSVLIEILINMLFPIPAAQRFLTKSVKYWAYVQGQGWQIFESECMSECPRCKDKFQQQVASMAFPFWSTRIATRLLWVMFKWGDRASVYSDRDIPTLTYILEVVVQTLAITYNRERLADAVYRTPAGKSKVAPRKEADVQRRITEPSLKERLASLESDVLGCCMSLEKVLLHRNQLEVKKGPFFSEERLFDCRRDPMAGLSHIQAMQYQKFLEDMKMSKTQCDTLAKGLGQKFKSVSTALMTYIKETRDQRPIIREMLNCVLANAAICNSMKEENRYRVVEGSSLVFPRFELITGKQ